MVVRIHRRDPRRCGIELHATRPLQWLALTTASGRYSVLVSVRRSAFLLYAIVLFCLAFAPRDALAIPFARRISLRAEAQLGLVLGEPQSTAYSVGAMVRGSVGLQLFGPLSFQVSVMEGIFPSRVLQTSLNTNWLGGLRFEPRTVRPEGRIFFDVNAGLAVTGFDRRFGFDVGVGWEFALTRYVYLGPVVRYSHIYQPNNLPGPDDAHYISFGLSFMVRPSPPPRLRRGTFVAIDPANLPDRDYDGVPDEIDQCPSVAEDHDGFEDEDGCPDRDDDNDGLPDSEDRCPRAAETVNDFEDEDGCPDQAPPGRERVEVDGQHLVTRQRVYFNVGQTRVQPLFFPTLIAVAEYLQAHPEVRSVRIDTHADDRGTRREGFSLSLRRAQSIRDFLVQRGVNPSRLSLAGYGDLAPLDRAHDEVTRARNRRVEFVITDGPAGRAPPPPAGVWTDPSATSPTTVSPAVSVPFRPPQR